MANLVQCDRCNVIDKPRETFTVTIDCTVKDPFSRKTPEVYNLCRECVTKLEKFLRKEDTDNG